MNLDSFKHLNVVVQEQPKLAKYTTFQLGGSCSFLFECQTPEQLEATVRYLNKKKKSFILIGGGSNLVVSDQGIETTVIRYLSPSPLLRRDGNDLIVSGSTLLDHLACFARDESLEGLNYSSGIPGTVGGAIVGNAGAFGKQVGDVLKSVTLLSKDGYKTEAGPEKLDFKYRYSNLRERDEIVMEARFSLKPGDLNALRREREEILATRKAKHPDLKQFPCAGSFFRNIEPTSQAGRRQAAGWFLEEAGGKNLSVGGARIFDKHANIIVKTDGCTAQQVMELSNKMKQLVKDKFDLDLVREVKFVGKFSGTEDAEAVIW